MVWISKGQNYAGSWESWSDLQKNVSYLQNKQIPLAYFMITKTTNHSEFDVRPSGSVVGVVFYMQKINKQINY